MIRLTTLALITMTLTACPTQGDDATTDDPSALQLAAEECGHFPEPEPGWSLTSYPLTPPSSTHQTCMTDVDYVTRDTYHQAVVNWGRCVEAARCSLGDCP